MENTNNKQPPQLRSIKKISFAWQASATTRLIRSTYTGKKRTTAIAIYQALSELASEAGKWRRFHTAQFPAPHAKIADLSGKHISTIKRYADEFRKLGILEWDTRKTGKVNKPNLWKLLACPVHYDKPTSMQDNGLAPVAHNNELALQEPIKKYLSKKGLNYDSERGRGFRKILE